MKKLIIITTILLASFAVNEAQAQVSVSINLGQQPKWGPRGYNHVDYYYIPDIQAYYSVPNRMFTYRVNGRWINSRNLPPAYRHYDLYRGNKVVVNERNPWLRHNYYMSKYNRRVNNAIRDDRRNDRREDRRNDNRYNNRDNHYNNGRDGHQNDKKGNKEENDRQHGHH